MNIRERNSTKDILLQNSVGFLVFLFCMARLAYMASMPDVELIKFIPDDAFYYLVLAKNFSIEQRWTFDGQAPASGFHLLWAYLLALFFSVFPFVTWKVIFLAASVLGSLAFSIAASLVATTMKNALGSSSVIGVVFVFLGSASIVQPFMVMEGPFVLLFSAALFFIFFRSADSTCSELFVAGAVGLLGMLSRSDFGLLPLALLCLSFFIFRDLRMVRISLSALLGGVAGLAIVVAHTFWLSGELAPASAQVKSYWAQVDGVTITHGYKILLALAFPVLGFDGGAQQSLYGLSLIATLLGVSLHAAFTHRARKIAFSVFTSAVTVIICYLLFYMHNGALQIWYAVNFLIPLSMLFGIATSAIGYRRTLLASLVVLMLSGYSLFLSLNAPWPWQGSMLRAGLYLRDHPIGGVVGAWNAGIVRYFSEAPIINLDGLVNDDILIYVKNDRLSDYVVGRQINYIMDFPVMLSNMFSKSHGYSDGKLAACLLVEYVVTSAAPEEQFGGDITLYKVRDNCLR